MRFDTLIFAATAVVVLAAFAGSDAQAQSGSRAVSALAGQLQGAAPTFAAPSAGSVVQNFSPGQGIVQGIPQGGVSSYVEAPGQYAPEYAPSPGSYSSQVATQQSGCIGCRGTGRVSTGQINGGCRHCSQETPIRTAQDYSAVPSCCGTLGQLDIPSLFTPPRYDRAPIGAAVGRPLFRQWQGY